MSAAAAVVATDMEKVFPKKKTAENVRLGAMAFSNSILAAALTLPTAQIAHADLAPERGSISYKNLDYHDSQPGQDRIGVKADSVMVVVPIAGIWSVEGGLASDTVSGASPSYYSQKLAPMHDKRTGREIRLTRYFSRGSLTVGGAFSSESDYFSHVYSVVGSISTEDKNTTFNLGLGSSNDMINAPKAVYAPVINQPKKSTDVMLGITQVLSMRDIAQLNISYSDGNGYYSDPYKQFDNRPDHKSQTAILTRWNHHFPQSDGTGRFSYRYYEDSFGVKAHTLGTEYVQPLPYGWTVTPEIRLYSQTAASFYVDPASPTGATFPVGYSPFSSPSFPATTIISEDQRLSAFGAITYGIKILNQLDQDWLLDLKLEHYEQQSKWNFQGQGSPGLDTLRARILQLGITRYF